MSVHLRPAGAPPGYPARFARDLPLRDGRHVLIRPVTPSDGPDIGEAIASSDPATLRSRFMGGSPRITPALLTRLSTVDYQRRFALVGRQPTNGLLVAVARYETLTEGDAEVAVAVSPRWRRVGLATALVEILAKAALEQGIDTFTAYYFADNRPVSVLVGLAGDASRTRISCGIAECAVALDRATVAAAVERLDAAQRQ